jgi:transcriptional regulator of acetoin/glycerol metabolism
MLMDQREYQKGQSGARSQAAKLLGIGKTTIYRKLKEYRLEDAPEVPPSA